MTPFMANLLHLLRATFLGPKKSNENWIYSQPQMPEQKILGRKFRKGDLWVDTSDSQRMYVWDGKGWVVGGGELVG